MSAAEFNTSAGRVWSENRSNDLHTLGMWYDVTANSLTYYFDGEQINERVIGASPAIYDIEYLLLRVGGTDQSNPFLLTDFTFSNTRPAAVPLPAAAWLFGSGILVLLGVFRRKSTR